MNWINVKERLPDSINRNNGRIVCIAYGFDPLSYHKEKWVLEAYYDSERNCFEYGEYDCPLEVTHWMPLPEPPKEDDIEEKCMNQKNEYSYVIVRTYSAGVFAGELESRNGREVVLRNARRLWYWDGAASLSQLCMEGVSKPENCKFPCEVDKVILLEAIEILDCTDKAKNNIKNVPIWKA